jgi:hypothetical protein
MAHFAELDENNIVLRVVVVSNEMLLEAGQESEAKGIAFCKQLFGEDTIWMQTSYNGSKRKNYAGIGFVYDQTRDAFIAPQPEGDGWTLDEELCIWRNLEAERIAEERRLIEEQTRIEVTRVQSGN